MLQSLVKVLVASEGRDLEPDIRADHDAAPDDAGRLRAVVDQVAGLTDISAPLWESASACRWKRLGIAP